MPCYAVVDSRFNKMYYSAIWTNPNHKRYLTDLMGVYHLFSFAYKKIYDDIGYKVPSDKVAIDSGGYSIHTLGLDLDIDDYAEWLQSMRGEYRVAFNYDSIGDQEQTYSNQKYLEELGLEVCPVFHLGDQYKHLQRYIDEGYTYIALGGMVRKGHKLKETFLRKCFALGVKEKIKFHGFGLGHVYCKKYPLYSIDNSNHLIVRRIGKLDLNGSQIKIKRVTGDTPEDRAINDSKPVVLQLLHNIKEFQDIVKSSTIYYKYFRDPEVIKEVIG